MAPHVPSSGSRLVARLRGAAAAARQTARLEARAARARRSGRPVALVVGNCQGPPLHDLLAASPAFAAAFAPVAIPAIHEISPAEARVVRRVLPRAGLIVTQPIGPGYRGLGLGTDELVARAPAACRTIRWPSLFWDRLFPYSVYVHTAPRASVEAPLVHYHDVRVLACAAAGMDAAATRRLLAEHVPPADGLEALHADMRALYGGVDDYCDVKVGDWIAAPEREARAFWTINHPARLVLEEIARQVHALLGLPYAPVPGPEPLAHIVAPIEAAVLGDRPGTPRTGWVAHGRAFSRDELADAHLAWYAARPEVVAAGAAEHARRRALLGLP